MTITFKGSETLKQAILNVACNEKHGNRSRIILDSLAANPSVANEVKRLEKKVKK